MTDLVVDDASLAPAESAPVALIPDSGDSETSGSPECSDAEAGGRPMFTANARDPAAESVSSFVCM
ncbi:MAG: hypothetical protein ACTH28_12010, partial [Brevibacterium aurantiacum]|nr:hypothetical protein [Brevibacterium sp.]MDN6193331.1 hypothetical protein [Brevibacterium sp.]